MSDLLSFLSGTGFTLSLGLNLLFRTLDGPRVKIQAERDTCVLLLKFGMKTITAFVRIKSWCRNQEFWSYFTRVDENSEV